MTSNADHFNRSAPCEEGERAGMIPNLRTRIPAYQYPVIYFEFIKHDGGRWMGRNVLIPPAARGRSIRRTWVLRRRLQRAWRGASTVGGWCLRLRLLRADARALPR